ncbi:MAG TPA: 2-succinyl-5-enolpyruvyl-6-hydroxy-3-cyclohexene-1-carboxylic-acid synthase, partial [Myxococcales bacterium]|nr:2-succinyl-5-enolpyruvyl-6-hydroxy-3-cyclohexene-1-carboxylic-acid synthase [Myxococcales bacterium]
MDNNERQSSLNNTLCGRLLVEELVRCGVMDFVIAPGSRSTPIVEAIVRHPVATLHVVVDERSAAFFALGYGRRQRTPAVMVTTSGSAIGHALPAIMEADQSDVPMIVISADRPVELRHSGANQTYEQVGIFSGRVRWQLDLPCPTQYTVFEPLLMSIGQAVANSAHGPVHLNMQFRKPLGPVDIDDLAALCLSVDQGVFDRPAMARWLDTQEPFCRWYPSARAALLRGNTDVSEVLALAQRGMLLIGGLDDDEGRAKAHELAMTLGWPVWADITSGLRGTLDGAHLGLLDAALSGSDGLWSETPDVVLRVGGTIVSERVQRWASTASLAMVAVTPRGRRHDPFHGVTHQVATSLTDFGTILSSRQLNTHLSSGWTRLCERLRGHGLDVKASIVEHGGTDSRVALRLFEELPSEVAIWVASSMPIRLLDTFGFEPRVARDLTASRGVSGIDGMFA